MEKAYSMVGGNPLALKLLVGQAASLPMDRVMENLLATERGTLTETILQRIYRHSWKLLLPSSRQVLLTMVRFSPLGATYIDLQTATGLSPSELDPALQQLVTHSLLFFDPAQTDRYIIHRLTYIFLWTLQRGGVMSLL
jgi:hypothetical protein